MSADIVEILEAHSTEELLTLTFTQMLPITQKENYLLKIIEITFGLTSLEVVKHFLFGSLWMVGWVAHLHFKVQLLFL